MQIQSHMQKRMGVISLPSPIWVRLDIGGASALSKLGKTERAGHGDTERRDRGMGTLEFSKERDSRGREKQNSDAVCQ